jgi:hypothetical protein
MRKSWALVTGVVVTMALGVGVSTPAGATARRDGTPTKLVKLAKSLGITNAGSRYNFVQEERNSDTLFLTVDVPTAWSDQADSHFIRPDSGEPYGVGLRATTDADAFHTSFDVPGMKVTADGLTPEEVDAFDTAQAVTDNAYTGCRKKRVKAFDNGVYEGSYQVFDRCDGKHAAAVVVVATGRGVEILVAAQVLTKADLAAIDRVLRTAKVERTSV